MRTQGVTVGHVAVPGAKSMPRHYARLVGFSLAFGVSAAAWGLLLKVIF